jgi:tetratricopeptide (TPR) repeat protein
MSPSNDLTVRRRYAGLGVSARMGYRGIAVVLAGALWAMAGDGVRAQQTMSCHATATAADVTVAPEKLPPPQKMTGIGNSYIEITAANAEAKAWFEQGLNLLHDFWDYEAARAFEQGVRSDPNCAMCYWGLAQALGFRGPTAPGVADALNRAVVLAKDKKNASKAERLYIKAAETGHKEQAVRSNHGPNNGASAGTKVVPYKDSKETKVLRKLVKAQPGDVQARIYLAESMMNGFDKDGKPKEGTAQGQQILVAILKEHPDDTAANHYWIHAVEPGLHPELALESAKKLGPLTPASGHMVHMPGHIFYRTGDYEAARLSFEDSMHVDEAYMQSQKVAYENDWNYVHNLMYLIADLMEAGRVTEAAEMSAKLTAAHGHAGPTLYRQVPRDGLSRLDVRLPVFLRAGAWSTATDALEKSAPDPELKNLVGLRSSMLDYTKGMLALEQGDVKAGAQAADDLDARVKEKPAEKMDGMPAAAMAMSPTAKDAMVGPLHSFLDVAAMELRASVLLAQGRGVESDAMFTKAADAERALGYREPPTYIRPVGETRGDALMRAKRYDEAKAAYQAALKERPNSGFPLFGIAQADEAAKRTTEATADYARLMQVWQQADADLPQLKAARAWMESRAVSGE